MMIKKLEYRKKALFIIILSIFIVSTIEFYVFAMNGDDSTSIPEIDGWKNGSTYVGGAAVEYNGFRIGNTVWCKPGDVLGVTAWGKQLSNSSWDNCIEHTYMSFSGADVFNKYLDVHYTDKFLDNSYTEYAACDIALIGSENGETSTNAKMLDYLRIGTIFWCQFKENNKTYSIRTNEYSKNGNWLYPEVKTPEEDSQNKWAYSIENIRTDGDAPSVSISPKSQVWTNKPINIGIDIKDSGSGIQKYRYSICKDGTWQDYDWIYTENHSNLDNSPFVRLYPASCQGLNHKIETSEDVPKEITSSVNSISNSIYLDQQGVYKVRIEAVDNLGNDSGWQQSDNYCIDTTAPNGVFTPDTQGLTDGDVVASFTPKDEGGSGVMLWRYRLSKDNGKTFGDWSSTIEGSSKEDIKLVGEGQWKIQAEVTDNAGNEGEVYGGPYEIDSIVTVSAAVAPNPAKQGQMITLDINTTGNAKYLSIYMPLEITMNDERGTLFPINKEIKEEENHNEKVQYIIPLKTPETIKNKIRVREPYKINIIAKKEDGKTANCEVNLDVMRNVLDGIKTEIIGTGFDK
ncbi:hypothetical protein [Clostridium acetobutylicum]|uniref:Uncharacterized protein n=1 Tax=Clostridium acetobutylicum (strain ATCC 824 / DSM 792 / JCM 1419 / IAM 19013 / LMG 5710 / NBRC 13948 / NRRL B-527 / VKM B-1787 / 2291 / W) TaxID=272562 RepID=Q97IV7_CLOAB|nr:hypothetical protein [Clostridium acetobutylicum]AAK79500.1 Hypothetical protein CA_C1533 [Clostridium acetobutylicum ATCC 824]